MSKKDHRALSALSAGIVVVARGKRAWRFLLVRAYRNWDFPKGVVGVGEDPLCAACREVEEETGLKELHFRWGRIFQETELYRGYGSRWKIARYYLAEAVAREGDLPQVILPVSPELGRPENDEYRWVTDREALRILPRRLQPIIHWARGTLNLS